MEPLGASGTTLYPKQPLFTALRDRLFYCPFQLVKQYRLIACVVAFKGCQQAYATVFGCSPTPAGMFAVVQKRSPSMLPLSSSERSEEASRCTIEARYTQYSSTVLRAVLDRPHIDDQMTYRYLSKGYILLVPCDFPIRVCNKHIQQLFVSATPKPRL